MNAALKRIILPVLRAKGFKGSFPHFRRHKTTQTELLTFQFSMSGGAFVVEIAKCPPGNFETGWGTIIAAQKLTAHDLLWRLRLGSNEIVSDHWFRFDEVDPEDEKGFDAVAEEILPHLNQQAERWWTYEGVGDMTERNDLTRTN